MAFLPLSFTFWRGIIWTPEMRGKGVPKMDFFVVYFCLSFFLPKWAPKLVQFFMIFGSNFGSLFWGLGFLWVSFGSLLGPLEALLRGLCSQKPLKTKGFLRFLNMQFFASLKLLMALLGSSWPLLGSLVPKWIPKWAPKVFQKVTKK